MPSANHCTMRNRKMPFQAYARTLHEQRHTQNTATRRPKICQAYNMLWCKVTVTYEGVGWGCVRAEGAVADYGPSAPTDDEVGVQAHHVDGHKPMRLRLVGAVCLCQRNSHSRKAELQKSKTTQFVYRMPCFCRAHHSCQQSYQQSCTKTRQLRL